MRHRLLFALITFSVVAVSPSLGADPFWPGWLGPDRNGWVSEFQPPKNWPDKLTKVWSANVGTGYGSPLVVAENVFQHARQGDDEVLWCFNLNSGKVKWRKSHAVPFKVAGGGEFHGKGPKSCPVYADGRVFTMSITGDLHARSAETGELLWATDYESKFRQNHPNWGAATSPIVDKDRVIVHFGNDSTGTLVALNAETGRELWSLYGAGASYSSPLVVEIQGVRQVVEWNHDALVGVDLDSGEQLWQFPFPHVSHNQNMPTPVFHEGRILLGGENRGLHSLEPVLVNGKWSVKQNWSQKSVALDMSTAVMNEDLLYGFSHYKKGQFFCVDTATGDVLWRSPGRTGQNVMFLSIPGFVVALIDNGQLRIIAANGEGYSAAASYRVSDSPTWAPPVLLNDGVLVKDKESLTVWSLTGQSADSQ